MGAYYFEFQTDVSGICKLKNGKVLVAFPKDWFLFLILNLLWFNPRVVEHYLRLCSITYNGNPRWFYFPN